MRKVGHILTWHFVGKPCCQRSISNEKTSEKKMPYCKLEQKGHQKHWCPQCTFAANAISNNSNQYAPQRARDITSCKGHERLHNLDRRIMSWEKVSSQNLGNCGIDPKVIPFQPIAKSCCEEFLVHLGRMQEYEEIWFGRFGRWKTLEIYQDRFINHVHHQFTIV